MKHLHKKIIAHNSFCSLLHNILMLVIMPIFLIPFDLLISIFDTYLGMVITMSVIASFTIFADYLTFNGISAKGFPIGMIKNSAYVESFMKDAILADQIRRFIQISFPPVISLIAIGIFSSEKIDLKFCIFVISIILLNYCFTTGFLAFMRNILVNTVYAYISLLSGIVISAFNVGIMLLFLLNSVKIPFIIWLPISLILSATTAVLVFRYTTAHCLKHQGDLT